MFERIARSFLVAMAVAFVACTDASGPIEGSSGTPTATGADSLPTATPSADVPPAKLTAVAAITVAPTLASAPVCPLDPNQCNFASRFDLALSTGNIDVLTARVTLSPMVCPTYEEFLRYACEGNPGGQVEAFFYLRKLGAFLPLNEARQWLAEYSVSALPALPGVAAVGCPVVGSCASAFAIVLRAQKGAEFPQVLLLSLRANDEDWFIDSASYLIGGDSEPALSNGVQAVVSNGRDIDYSFTRWQP